MQMHRLRLAHWLWLLIICLAGGITLSATAMPATGVAATPQDTFSFSAEQYDVAETGGAVTVTIQRANGVDAGRRVEFYAYTMYCGGSRTATADRDYLEAHERPFFAPGETSKSFTIAILDDGLTESDEGICLQVFSEPEGQELAFAVVIIRDDEARQAPLPGAAYLPVIQSAPYTRQCNPSGGIGGLAPGSYDTTVAGRKAMVVVGRNYNPARPTLLAFYLHGDEGDYKLLTGNTRTRQLVDELGWILVSPRALGDEQQAFKPWRTYFIANKAKLVEIFETLFTQYNLCRDLLVGSAASGGSFFWDIFFFPGKGLQYPAFMLLNCGAGPSFANPHAAGLVTQLGQTPAIVVRTRVQLSYGSDDFLFANIQESIKRLREAGFGVVVDEMAGKDHCDFDIDAKTRGYWSAVANELQSLLP